MFEFKAFLNGVQTKPKKKKDGQVVHMVKMDLEIVTGGKNLPELFQMLEQGIIMTVDCSQPSLDKSYPDA
jgi:hypothetical protein